MTDRANAGGDDPSDAQHGAALREHSVFNATQSIEHAFGANIGIKQAQRHIAAKRRIGGFEPTHCGGSVVKDFIRAADNPSQAPNLGRFFAVQGGFVPSSANAA